MKKTPSLTIKNVYLYYLKSLHKCSFQMNGFFLYWYWVVKLSNLSIKFSISIMIDAILCPSSTIHKLQHQATPFVFLGYPTSHHGYKYYDLLSNKIIISRHVIFDKTTISFCKLFSPKDGSYYFLGKIFFFTLYMIYSTQISLLQRPNRILRTHYHRQNCSFSITSIIS